MSKPFDWFVEDNRTEVKKRQQALWQLLGTLARTKATLDIIARPNNSYRLTNEVWLTALEQRVLDAAVYVLNDIYCRAQERMKTLPSKKNLKAKENVPSESSIPR